MVLSDADILKAISDGDLNISPFHPEDVQPASLDLHLGSGLRIPVGGVIVDPMRKRFPAYHDLTIDDEHGFQLYPGAFILAHVEESVSVGLSLVARLEGVSSMARVGLIIHTTAGFVDPGWSGLLTLELVNVSQNIIILRPGMRICQITFLRMSSPVTRSYQAKPVHYIGAGVESPHG